MNLMKQKIKIKKIPHMLILIIKEKEEGKAHEKTNIWSTNFFFVFLQNSHFVIATYASAVAKFRSNLHNCVQRNYE